MTPNIQQPRLHLLTPGHLPPPPLPPRQLAPAQVPEPEAEPSPAFENIINLWKPMKWALRAANPPLVCNRLSAQIWEHTIGTRLSIYRLVHIMPILEKSLVSDEVSHLIWMLGATGRAVNIAVCARVQARSSTRYLHDVDHWQDRCRLGATPDRAAETRFAFQVCSAIALLYLNGFCGFSDLFNITRRFLPASLLWRRAAMCLAGTVLENLEQVRRAKEQRLPTPRWLWLPPEDARRAVESRIIRIGFTPAPYLLHEICV